MSNENTCNIFKDFNRNLMDYFTGDNPRPSTSEEYLESEEFKILRNFLSNDQYMRHDLYNNEQWKKTLFEYLPDRMKPMIQHINLMDYQMKKVESYDKIVEEFHYNIGQIYNFALLFINEKNKGEDLYEPVQIANVLKHLAIGLVSEVNKYNYYKTNKHIKANVSL